MGDTVANGRAERSRGERRPHITDHNIRAARLQPLLPALLETTRHTDESHNSGDAEGDAKQRETCADRAPEQSSKDDSEESHDTAACRPSSEMMCPSCIRTRREARPAIDISWVTSTSV